MPVAGMPHDLNLNEVLSIRAQELWIMSSNVV